MNNPVYYLLEISREEDRLFLLKEYMGINRLVKLLCKQYLETRI